MNRIVEDMSKNNKYLITGFSGFVSKHFLDYLNKYEPGAAVFGIDICRPSFNLADYRSLSIQFAKIDLLDKEALAKCFAAFQPNYIVHLAAASSVAYSWQEPAISFRNNTNVFLSLLEAIRKSGGDVKVLSVGSSEVYGNVPKKMLPIKEITPLNPLSPYAVARVAQEMISRVYVDNFHLKIVMTRSFNHIGPGQKDIFVISSFAKQMVEAKKKGLNKGQIVTGDVSIIRDFLDVRDVVRAYSSILKRGESGEVYNVCGGQGVVLRDVIEKIADIVGIKVTIKVNKELIRPSDNKIIIGSSNKIKHDLGWKPEISLERSLQDITRYWDENSN